MELRQWGLIPDGESQRLDSLLPDVVTWMKKKRHEIKWIHFSGKTSRMCGYGTVVVNYLEGSFLLSINNLGVAILNASTSPLSVQFSSFSCSFERNLGKIYWWAPPPPTLGLPPPTPTPREIQADDVIVRIRSDGSWISHVTYRRGWGWWAFCFRPTWWRHYPDARLCLTTGSAPPVSPLAVVTNSPS